MNVVVMVSGQRVDVRRSRALTISILALVIYSRPRDRGGITGRRHKGDLLATTTKYLGPGLRMSLIVKHLSTDEHNADDDDERLIDDARQVIKQACHESHWTSVRPPSASQSVCFRTPLSPQLLVSVELTRE